MMGRILWVLIICTTLSTVFLHALPTDKRQVAQSSDAVPTVAETVVPINAATESTVTEGFGSSTVQETGSTSAPATFETIAVAAVEETTTTTATPTTEATTTPPSVVAVNQQASGGIAVAEEGRAAAQVLSSGGGSGAEDRAAQRCWAEWNGHDNATWHEEGEVIERGHIYYECRAGRLVTIGCLNEKGERIPIDGTYVSERNVIQCQHWGLSALRKVIGCVPDGQGGKTYMQSEIWINYEKQTWGQCVLNDAWNGGCVVDTNGTASRINVGQIVTRGLSTFECQHKHFEGYRMVPVGCIFGDEHFTLGQIWQDNEFIFFCKQQTAFDEATTRLQPNGTCIDCILRNQRLFDGDKVFLRDHAEKCEKRVVPNTLCAGGEEYGPGKDEQPFALDTVQSGNSTAKEEGADA